MRLALERRVSGNCEPALGLSIRLAKTTYMVSYRHCTFRERFVLGASSCHLHIYLKRNLLQHSLSTTYCSQLSSAAMNPPRTLPSPPLCAISASCFLIGNTLYCNETSLKASKQARTLHVLLSNPFDSSSITLSTHLAGLNVPSEQNNLQLYSVLRSMTCFAGGKRGKKGQQHIILPFLLFAS